MWHLLLQLIPRSQEMSKTCKYHDGVPIVAAAEEVKTVYFYMW